MRGEECAGKNKGREEDGGGYKASIHYKEGLLWTLDLVGLWTLSFKTHFLVVDIL